MIFDRHANLKYKCGSTNFSESIMLTRPEGTKNCGTRSMLVEKDIFRLAVDHGVHKSCLRVERTGKYKKAAVHMRLPIKMQCWILVLLWWRL